MSQTTISNASFVDDDDDEGEEEDDEFDEEGEEDSQDEKLLPTVIPSPLPPPPPPSPPPSSSSASLLQVRRETLFDEKGEPLWNKLPVALLSHIFSMLSTPLQLVNTMVVCKSWCLAYTSAPKNNNTFPSFSSLPSVSSSSSPNPSSSSSSASATTTTTTTRRQKLKTEEEEELWHRLHRNHFGGSKFSSEEKKRFDTLAGLEGVVDTDGSPLQRARNWKEQFKQDVLILAQLRVLEQALLWATNFGYHLVVRRLLYQHHVKLLVDPRDEEEHEQQQGATSVGSNMAEADERRHQKEEEDLETNTTNTPSDLTDLELLDLSKRRGGEELGGTRKEPYLIAQSLIDLEYRSPTKVGEGGDASPTPLLLAVMKGYIEIAQMLLAFGAEADARLLDGSEKTALHIAVGFKSHSAANCGNTTATITPPPPQSIEEKEIEESRMDLLRLLLARRADTELRAKHGLTPLIIAASVDNLPAVQLLLENDADVDARTYETELTGLHIAVQNGNLRMVNALLAAGALVDARSNRLNTPLHLAAAGTNPEVVRVLLLTGSAKVNAVNKKLWTPLHFAACENSIECARVLLEYGANPRAETKYRLTPIDFAYERQHKVLLKLLKKHEKCILM